MAGEAGKQHHAAGNRQQQRAETESHHEGIVEILALAVVHDVQHPEDIEQAPGVVAAFEHPPICGGNIQAGVAFIRDIHAPDGAIVPAGLHIRLCQVLRGTDQAVVAGVIVCGDCCCQRRVDDQRIAIAGIAQFQALTGLHPVHGAVKARLQANIDNGAIGIVVQVCDLGV